MHERFSGLIAEQLETAVAEGIIPPIDTAVAGMAWFGALNEVVMRWLMAEPHGRLEDTYRPCAPSCCAAWASRRRASRR